MTTCDQVTFFYTDKVLSISHFGYADRTLTALFVPNKESAAHGAFRRDQMSEKKKWSMVRICCLRRSSVSIFGLISQ